MHAEVLTVARTRNGVRWKANKLEVSSVVDHCVAIGPNVTGEGDSDVVQQAVIGVCRGEPVVNRTQLLRRWGTQFIRIRSGVPQVEVQKFTQWRLACLLWDEELLVAAAIADLVVSEALVLSKGKKTLGEARLGRSELDLIVQLVRAWPVHVGPACQEFRKIWTSARDHHMHKGELVPSGLLWRKAVEDPTSVLVGEKPADTRIGYAASRLRALFHETTTRRGVDVGVIDAADVARGGSRSPRGLAPERVMTCWLLACEFLGWGDENQVASRVLWRYLQARAAFMRSVGSSSQGFRSFQTAPRVRLVEVDEATKREALEWLVAEGIGQVDLRAYVSLGGDRGDVDGPFANGVTRRHLREIGSWIAAVGQSPWSPPQLNIVAALSKTPIGARGNQLPLPGRRPPGWVLQRRRVQKAMRALRFKPLERVHRLPETPHLVVQCVGVDMVSSELGFDPGIVAPAYAERATVAWEGGAYAIECAPLIRTFHSGETTSSPMTSVRVIWEALEWLRLGAGDRLGHATVLALPVEEWADRDTRMTQGEHLDNLVWLWDRVVGRGDPAAAEAARAIAQFSRLVHEPARKSVGIDGIVRAWNMRPLELDELSSETGECKVAMAAFCGWSEAVESGLDGVADRAVVEKMWANRAEPVSASYPSALCEAALQCVIKLVRDRGVRVESCPSSNMTIGHGLRSSPATGRLLQQGLDRSVLLGSDDPCRFKTNLKVEAALVYGQIRRAGTGVIDAAELIKRMCFGAG